MKTLHQLDQDLNQRCALLGIAHDSTLPAEASQRLAQTGLPEFVWASPATCCTAATVTLAVPSSPKQMTIIGDAGQMGRYFTQQFTAAGHRVQKLRRDDWEHAAQYFKGSVESPSEAVL